MKEKQFPELQIKDGVIEGLRLLEPSCYHDYRGYYWTIYNENSSDLNGISFNHDKATVSKEGALRGIHGDFSTSKMISCLYGEVYCVVVDKRKDSDTHNMWYWTMLTHTNRKSILIPPGAGLAYYVTSPEATIFLPTNNPILQRRDA
mgnify:CR=1 FL=1